MTGRRGRLAALLAALAVAACGPDGPVASPTPTPAPEPTPSVTAYRLDTTAWYAGLVMTFGTATAELDARGGSVDIDVQVENPGPDALLLSAPILLTSGPTAFEPTRETVLPLVGAASRAYTTLHFDIIGRAALDDAILRVGRPGDHQAEVPFVPGQVATTTLEPVTLKVSGTANASDLRLVVRSGELRWDLPDWGAELPMGTAALTLTYDVSYRGSFSGGFAFTGDNVTLTLPDGTSIGPRRDGRSQSVALVGPGKTLKSLATRFEIPSGVAGKYLLVVRNGSAHASIAIVVPG